MAPSDTAAVVGGNVESSQVITGVVLKAFKAAAASQSSCNNLTFGSGGKDEQGEHVEGWGYVRRLARASPRTLSHTDPAVRDHLWR